MADSSSQLRLSASSIAPGVVVGGKYRVDRVLGAGGMGVVLLATHLELEAQVAIKVVRDELARNEEVVARMLFEARAVAKLRSSHVVRVLDVARLESGAPYIVMERLEGSDLANLLTERGPLPIQEAVDYVLQACEGLAEAHALGIVHRDLKPENLFRANTHEGLVVKVLDFGISKEVGGGAAGVSLSPRSVMTTAGYAVGSPFYMSPEQMRAGEVDARADIWSLGAILYELLSGTCPFEGESLPVVCARVLGDEPAASLSSVAPRVPEGLSAVVARCLRKRREERFESVAALVKALRVFASVNGQRSAERMSRPWPESSIQHTAERAPATPPPLSASVGVVSPSASLRRHLAIAAAFAGVAGLGLVWSLLPSSVEPEPKPAAPAVAPLVAEVESSPASAPIAPATIASAPASASATSVLSAVPVKSRAAQRLSALPATASVSPTSTEPPKPPAPIPSAPRAPGGAWDPDRLGGRY